MTLLRQILLVAGLLFLMLIGGAHAAAAPETKQVTIIALNDVYRLDNLPYVRSLRARLEREEGPVLVLHAGDFLFPSLLSSRYQGAQMIDALNRLDGDGSAYDPYLFVTFGNHEFDKSKRKHAVMLQSRIRESQFGWLDSNIEFAVGADGEPLITADQLYDSKLLQLNGIRLGLVSASTDVAKAAYVERFLPPVETVRRITRELRALGAEAVIALTHLTMDRDRALLEALGDEAPDLLIGGHEHNRQTLLVNGRRIVKADSDAQSVAVIRLRVSGDTTESDLEFVEFPGDFPKDTRLQALADGWNRRFDREYCAELQAPPGCLGQTLGRTRVELVAEELTIRRFETNTGNWLADLARRAFADRGAQIAFLNSGSMRLNYNLPAGTDLTREHIDTLLPYPMHLALIRLTGAQLQRVVDHAITDWTGNGRWLQISGFAFRHDPETGTASGLSLITPAGVRPVRPEETILAVVNDYLLDASGDQDGYRELAEPMAITPTAERPELKDLILHALRAAGANGISPREEGRICNLALGSSNCLAN